VGYLGRSEFEVPRRHGPAEPTYITSEEELQEAKLSLRKRLHADLLVPKRNRKKNEKEVEL
jgi:hypothetical protein